MKGLVTTSLERGAASPETGQCSSLSPAPSPSPRQHVARFRLRNAIAGYGDGYWALAPVRRYSSEGFGTFDMLGNVSEWVEDCWNEGYAKAPIDGGPWTLGECGRRVVRGGSWFNVHSRQLRSANRVSHSVETRVSATGFRVARRL